MGNSESEKILDTLEVKRMVIEQSFNQSSEGILLSVLSITLILCAVVLIHRTASVTNNSRFLRHLEVAFAATIFFRVGNILCSLAKSVLVIPIVKMGPSDVNSALASVAYADVIEVSNAINSINNTWIGVSTMGSFTSTFFLFLAWWLLKHFPNKGIPRGFYVSAVGICGGLVTLAAGVVAVTKANALFTLYLFDIGTSSAGIVLVGFELRKIQGDRSHPALSGATFVLYMCWAMLQFGVHIFRHDPGHSFFWVLMFAGFGAMLSTALLTSYVLEDRPEFQNSSERAAH